MRRAGSVLLVVATAACQGIIVDGGSFDPPVPGAGGAPTPAGAPAGAGPPPVSPPAPSPAGCARTLPPARIWRLTAEQYVNTVAAGFGYTGLDPDVFPREAVDTTTGFEAGPGHLVLGETMTRAAIEQAERIAARVGGALAASHPCTTRAPIAADCLRGFVGDVGRRAFRRPLTSDEVDRYATLFEANVATHGARGAAEVATMALLLSPNFLYRTELGAAGNGAVALEPFELASALSYGLLDAPPDRELMAAAEARRLSIPAELERQARRLARLPAAAEKLARFVQAQLGSSVLESAVGDPSLRSALLAETRTFVREMMASPAPTLETLYLAPFTYIDGTLADVYGLATRPRQVERVALDPQQRFGVFTQPAFLRARQGAIHRGKVFREAFLCEEIPLPPENAALQDSLPPVPRDANEADRWRAFQQALPACAACHTMFQPLGVAFDRYDDVGRHRLKNAFGRAIEPAGEISGAVGWSGRFSDARDLVRQVLASEQGRSCFARRVATFLMGWSPAANACGARAVAARFAGSGLDLRELLVALVTDETFFTRAKGETTP